MNATPDIPHYPNYYERWPMDPEIKRMRTKLVNELQHTMWNMKDSNGDRLFIDLIERAIDELEYATECEEELLLMVEKLQQTVQPPWHQRIWLSEPT